MKDNVSKNELILFFENKIGKRLLEGFVFFEDTGINGMDAETLMHNFGEVFNVKESILYTETDLIDLIERLVKEEKSNISYLH